MQPNPRCSSIKIIYYRQGTAKVRKYHKVDHRIIQHGVLSQDYFFKKRKERFIERNPMKIFRNNQEKTEYSSGLENIRIYRQ